MFNQCNPIVVLEDLPFLQWSSLKMVLALSMPTSVSKIWPWKRQSSKFLYSKWNVRKVIRCKNLTIKLWFCKRCSKQKESPLGQKDLLLMQKNHKVPFLFFHNRKIRLKRMFRQFLRNTLWWQKHKKYHYRGRRVLNREVNTTTDDILLSISTHKFTHYHFGFVLRIWAHMDWSGMCF